jgi:Plasmid pRiA4b ORF-3-like protein
VEDATAVVLGDEIDVGHRSSCDYDYDFGDGWRLEVVVESGAVGAAPAPGAACTGGERAGPPEDCGGPDGYAALLEALSDPGHPEHDDAVTWVGEGFDPASFSLVEANAAVQRVPE